MSIKHTPGPWRFDGMWSLIKAGKYEIAAVHAARTVEETRKRKRIDEVNANALLIAAAPELLKACKMAYRNLEMSEAYVLVDMLKAAIEKAEGKL